VTRKKAASPRPPSPKAAVPMATRPLTPSVWTTWSVNLVRRALLEHELGDFAVAAQLTDHLRRDDRIFATLDSRVLGALGLPYSTVPSEETDARQQAEAIARRVHSWWFRCIPEAVLADVLRHVILAGFCVAEIIWEQAFIPTSRNFGSHEIRPRLRIHPAEFIRYDSTRAAWLLQTLDGEQVVTPGDGRWVLFASGSDRPWMNGALRSLAIPWLMRTFGRRDWARRIEIEGIGVRKAKLPAEYDQAVAEKFLSAVRNLGAETTLTLPDGYDFAIDATDLQAAEGFSRFQGAQDLAITLVLLGANLPTEAKSGGSFALGKVQAEAQLDRLEADVEMLSTVCREQIIKPWGRFCVEGWIDELAPHPFWDPTPPANTQQHAAALLTVSQALTTLHALGVDITPQLDQFRLRVGPEGLKTPPVPSTAPPPGAQPPEDDSADDEDTATEDAA
jgi:phage gp29-like protein